VIRHELVHRNGKREDGSEHDIGESDIRSLMEMTRKLVEHIENEWLNASPSL
jgi:hypothetical protein